MAHQEVIIRIVSSSQVIGSDLLFISAIQTDLCIKKGLRANRKPFAYLYTESLLVMSDARFFPPRLSLGVFETVNQYLLFLYASL